MKQIVYKPASTDTELYEILSLQKENIPSSLSAEDKLKEGFVTVVHDFKTLKAMNNACPHSIATYKGKVIGYALSMLPAFKNDIDTLKPMFDIIDTHIEPNYNYVVMGQICVDKKYRGKGVFRALYNNLKTIIGPNYNAIITDIDIKNTRSLKAHYSIGFKPWRTFLENNQNWEIIILEI